VNERFVEEVPVCIGDVVMFFFSKELFLPGPDVRTNRIEVVVRVPE
jgi:hypothetical protein